MKCLKNNHLVIPILAIFLFSIVACKKDNSPKPDEYYVKYVVESKTIYYGVKLVTSITNEKNETQNLEINTGNWELVIGPVKKGFNASLLTTKKNWNGSTENHLRITLSIFTSKNNGPFALKIIDDDSSPRATANLSHTID